MKAVGYFEPGSIDREDALQDVEVDRPSPSDHDLLVRVHAVSVNPVDTKVRSRSGPDGSGPKILGWDAVGEVVETGGQASRFRAGDTVWYAGG